MLQLTPPPPPIITETIFCQVGSHLKWLTTITISSCLFTLQGGVCHNDICLSTIFVGSNGRWLLGGLDYMCRFDEATAAYLNKCKSLRNQNSLAPEEKVSSPFVILTFILQI